MKTTIRRLAFLVGILLVLVLIVALWPQRPKNSASSKTNATDAINTKAGVAEALDVLPPPTPTPRPERGPVSPEEIVGIGAVLRGDNRTGTVRIVDVLPDSPAFRAGLTSGLIIQKVDGVEIAGLGLVKCVSLLRGPAGSKVRVEVIDPDAESTNVVELIRQRVKVQM
jgi:S1-C subfamily serine protease